MNDVLGKRVEKDKRDNEGDAGSAGAGFRIGHAGPALDLGIRPTADTDSKDK